MNFFQKNLRLELLVFPSLGSITNAKVGFNRLLNIKEGLNLLFNTSFLLVGIFLLSLTGCTAHQIDKMLDKIPDNKGPVSSGEPHSQNNPDSSGFPTSPPPIVVKPRPPIRATCERQVQGRIPWDYKGNKKWARHNINRLCKGAENSAEPGRCFKRVMHGGINWGGSTKWEWKNAINLCEGSRNANATISCFQRNIKNRRGWQQAIRTCSK